MDYDPKDHIPARGAISAAWAVWLMVAALGLTGPAVVCESVQAAHSGLALAHQELRAMIRPG